MNRYLIYLGHPAHFHLFKHAIGALKGRGHAVEILIKQKDVLEALLQGTGWPYRNVLARERGDGKLRIAWSLLVRDAAVFRIARVFRPHLMLGTSAEIAHVGRLLGIPAVVVNEDDADVVPLFARLAYPFADAVLAPTSCRVGRWEDRAIRYEGYHELAYLHPDHFTPDEAVASTLRGAAPRYFVLRFAKLNAHHDAGRTGITTEVAARLIGLLEPHGRVYVSAERALEQAFEPYRIRIAPGDMHSALAGADLYVGDSQTMAAEAAVLGTPSIRFNDFVGQIGYLEELEHRYGLTVGVPTAEPQRLYALAAELVGRPDLREEWQRRRGEMLKEKINFADYLVQLAEAYPTRAERAEARMPRPAQARLGAEVGARDLAVEGQP